MIWPPYSELMDFELELGCVIGRKGKDIPAERALEHVFGFTIFNDFSARDVQTQERPLNMGPMKGKDFDTGNVLGPWIVTRDEIGDPHTLDMEARINGERWGGGNSKRDASLVQRDPRVHLALRDAVSGRGDRVRHGADRLRPGARTVP